MNVTVARSLLILAIIVSGFPLAAVLGLLFSFAFVGGGIIQVMNGAIFKGIVISFTFAGAFFGVFSLSKLVFHFWRTPLENPVAGAEVGYGVGLMLGWVAMLCILFGVVEKDGEILVGSLSLLPVAIVITWFWLTNKIRQSSHRMR